MGKHKHVLCKVCYRSIRGNNLKRHSKIHIKYKETIDQNTNKYSAVGCNDILLVKNEIKHRRNTQEEDNEKDSCNNEDE